MMAMTNALEAYRITKDDLANIRAMAPLITQNKERLADQHYERLLSHPETRRFFTPPGAMERARHAFIAWLEDFAAANYNLAYAARLDRMGATHVRIGLPAQQVNIAMANLRADLTDIVINCSECDQESLRSLLASMNKALDLSLDLMTRSYREEELKVNFLSFRLDSWIIQTARWFVTGFNMALVLGLLVTGALALALSVYDFSHFATDSVERGVLGALGSLLILWVVIELLDTQINHLKGRAFAIKVFISVALVAEIRKALMTSIGHTTWQDQLSLVLTILILGAVYWLVARVEKD